MTTRGVLEQLRVGNVTSSPHGVAFLQGPQPVISELQWHVWCSVFAHNDHKEEDMGLIAIIVIGLLGGLVARALMPGTQSMNLVGTTLLGVAGSFVGGLVNSVIFHNADWFELRPTGLLFSVIGALAVLALMGVGQRVRS